MAKKYAQVALTPGSGGTPLTVKDEGSDVSTTVVSIDFTGAGVDATGGDAVSVSIPGGGGGSGSTYRNTVVDGDLSGGVVTITHNLAELYNTVFVYDNNDVSVIPDAITVTDNNTLTLDLSSYQAANGGTLPGTYNVVVRS